MPTPTPGRRPEMASSRKAIAFFDFDGTLVRGDSLLPFLVSLAGPWRTRAAFARAAEEACRLRALGRLPDRDVRGAIKTRVLARTLEDVPLEDALDAGRRLTSWIRWKTPVVDALKRHADQGHRVVVATGALSLYMPGLLEDLPVDALIATDLAVDAGRLTGAMLGANNVRAEKARRVALHLEEAGPFGESWGYGNRPSDLPMLALLDHRTVV